MADNKWTDYTTASELTDDDEIMALDTSAKANKRTLLSKLSDFILDKLATKVYEKLGTQNKTVIGALNELNSKQIRISNDADLEISYTIKSTSKYDTFFILGQKDTSGIADIVNTHNTGNITLLRLDSKIINYAKADAGTFCLTMPGYSSVCVMCGNTLSVERNQ